MEKPIPDLIYYQRIVDNIQINGEPLRYELQDLINEVKEYIAAIQNRPHSTKLHVDACKCPQGSICEFFNKLGQCQYGKI